MISNETIKKSEDFIQWLDKQIVKLKMPSDSRNRLAGGCLDVALEHQKAILLLIAKKLYGSAFALVRILYESYIRGIWLQHCATESQLTQFRNGTVPLFHKLIEDIEKIDGFENGFLTEFKKNSWARMNGFVHTGVEQVVCRNTTDSIEPNYDKDEVIKSIDFSNGIACLSAIAICRLANDVSLAENILNKHEEYWPQDSQ
ncbi:MAG: hypothetical protein KAI27_01170 [Rhodospirillaceae bacterium]|nr:hypothetical protein [Rhodospirillaceae bacterium]